MYGKKGRKPKMKKKVGWCLLYVFLFMLSTFISMSFDLGMGGGRRRVVSDETAKNTNESIVSYAMKWDRNPNILYVYGGDRVHSLEELDAGKIGTDCSGFVTRVYQHFGYNLPAQSGELYRAAKKVFTNQAEAIPGDICWWNGHVGLYVGENRMIHTNTKNPPNNIIHVNTLGVDYKVPSAYLRMIDDEELKKLNKGGTGTGNSSTSNEDKETVLSAESGGSLVTESDLTGMVMEESLLWNQDNLNLMTAADLSVEDQENVANIKESIVGTKVTMYSWTGKATSVIGLVLLVYGVLLFVSGIFDYVNTFIEVSILGILSFGHWKLVSQSDVDDGLIEDGRVGKNHTVYLTVKSVAFRSIVVIVVGFIFVSGYINRLIVSALSWVGVV